MTISTPECKISTLTAHEGNVSIALTHGVQVIWGDTILALASGETMRPERRKIVARRTEESVCHFFYRNNLVVEHRFIRESNSLLRVSTKISGKNASFARVIVGQNSRMESPVCLDRVFWQTEAMDGFGGVETAPAAFTSWGMAALTQSSGNPAILAGFMDFSAYHGEVSGTKDTSDQNWLLSFGCDLEGLEVADNRPLQIPDITLHAGDGLAVLLDDYAKAVGQSMGASSFPQSPRGWCSWYCYYGTESEKDILANLDSLATSPLAESGAIFQIDDGWNLPFANHPRVWGDWQPGQKFSQGMGWIAEKIREKNLKPGLWLAPFSVDKKSQLAAQHPEWLVQMRDPVSGDLRPAQTGDCYALDLTRKEVLDFIRDTFRRVFSEWKFDYVKIDFLKHGIVPGIRQDASITSRQAFRNALRIIREEAGKDRFILACGCPFGPAIGICDGMRVGMDVGGGWNPPLTLPEWRDGNCCVKAAAKPAFYRHWMHRRWWINDPDCLVARDTPLPCEVEELTKTAASFGAPPQKPRFCLSDEEANFWTRLVSLLGGSTIFSEILDTVPENRKQLLYAALAGNEQAVRWVDCYENPEICFLQTVEKPLRIAVLNFSDEPCLPQLPSNHFHMCHWVFKEDIKLESFSGGGPIIKFPSLPERSVRIWRLVTT